MQSGQVLGQKAAAPNTVSVVIQVYHLIKKAQNHGKVEDYPDNYRLHVDKNLSLQLTPK